MDFTIAPKSANFLHIVTAGTGKTGVGVASFTPNALFEIQSGSGGPDLRITQTGNNNVGFSLVNTSQRTDFTIRATASGLCTVNESVVWRDTTGGADLFCIAPVSGNSIFLGNVKLPSLNMTQALLLSGTQPTIAGAGCGGSAASIGTSNGTASFVVNVGTAPTTACTVTMPTASNGWNCYATDISTNSTTVFLQKQTATGASSITITNFNDVAVGANFSANDVLQVSCFAR
jgi:hypothetical protein